VTTASDIAGMIQPTRLDALVEILTRDIDAPLHLSIEERRTLIAALLYCKEAQKLSQPTVGKP
jgi:hypothetical protein